MDPVSSSTVTKQTSPILESSSQAKLKAELLGLPPRERKELADREDEKGRTHLSLAILGQGCANDQFEWITFLIKDCGATVKSADLIFLKNELLSFYPPKRTEWANGQNETGMSILSHAIESHSPKNNQLEWITFLIKNCKADVNLADKDDWSPLYRASTGKHGEIFLLLLSNGADFNKANKDGSTPLHRAVDRGCFEEVEALIEKEADVNALNCFGTPLAYAAKNGNLIIALTLLNNGANANLTNDPIIFTPLELAQYNGKSELVDLLKNKGAREILPLDSPNHTHLSKLALEGSRKEIIESFWSRQEDHVDKFGRNIAHYCAYYGKSDHLQALKLTRFDDVDIKGRTPLHYAVIHGQQKIVDYLLNSGRVDNPLACDNQGYSSLMHACQYNRPEIAELLLEKNKELLDIADNFGWLPIHKAAQVGNVDTLKLLVSEYKVDHTQKTANGRTPLDLAKEANAAEAIFYLESLKESPMPFGVAKA